MRSDSSARTRATIVALRNALERFPRQQDGCRTGIKRGINGQLGVPWLVQPPAGDQRSLNLAITSRSDYRLWDALVPAEANAPYSAIYLATGADGPLSRRNDAAAR